MESMVTLVKSLDPASQAAVAFLVVLGFLALRMFPKATPVRVRLVVFFTLVGFAGGGLAYSRRNAEFGAATASPRDGADTPRPVAATIGSVMQRLSMTSVVNAADNGGWIFVGKYDKSRARWLEGPTVALRDARNVPQAGDEIKTIAPSPLYDDQPRFSVFSQAWKLGAEVSEVGSGRHLTVVDTPVFVGPNVWCRVHPR
jgi:hypothetical protein